jgi:hypothetical protein
MNAEGGDGASGEAVSGQAGAKANARNGLTRGYFGKPKNWVSLLTLLFVGVYTGLTYCTLQDADDALKVSRDTERRQLRAYLYVDHGELLPKGPSFDARVPIGATINLHAAGSTPAYKLRLAATVEIGDFPLPKGQLSDPAKRGGGEGITRESYPILFGDAAIHQRVEVKFLPEALALLNQPQQHHRFYLFGSVRYFDIFGIEDPKLERRYDFCFSLEADPSSSIKAAEEDGCDGYNKPG